MKSSLAAPALAAVCFLLAEPSQAATTRHVRQDGSGDYTTVGAAVAASAAGDIIEVGPGVYHERVDVYHTLTFVSTDGAAATVMDGDGTQHPLWFLGGTGHSVDGFTFQHGYNPSGGGAVRCMGGATLTVRNSVFESNVSGYDGGALFTRDPGAFIDAYDCVFHGNHAARNAGAGIAILGSRINYTRCMFAANTCDELSGAITCDRSSMDVSGCLFIDNVSAVTMAAIYYHMSFGLIQGNTLYSNASADWGSILIQDSPGTNVTRNIMVGDEGAAGLAYYVGGGAHSCNVFYSNAGGLVVGGVVDPTETNADPLFCDAANGDFAIANQSPAAPAQSLCGQLIGAFPTHCDIVPPIPTTRHVRQDGSGDYTTVGAAVAASAAGDIIEVGPGVYHERVDVYHTLTFVSTDGAAATVMDGDGTQHPLWFLGGTGHSVDGFTFQHGYNPSGGGAVRCMGGATLTVRNSVFESNVSGYDGGALFTRDPGAFIDAYDCVFHGNHAARNAGAGIAILGSRINYTRCSFISNSCDVLSGAITSDASSMDVRDCLFRENASGLASGAIYYDEGSTGMAANNTLYSNSSGGHGSLLIQESPAVVVVRNIVVGDTQGAGLAFLYATCVHSCNVFFANAAGSILGGTLAPSEVVADPLFCSAAVGDFTIPAQSPAAPGQSPCGQLIGAFPATCNPVAVAIVSFSADATGVVVSLHGRFHSTFRINAVNVYRGAAVGDHEFTRIATVADVDGDTFEYVDESVEPGRSYRYQIGAVDPDGEFLSAIITVSLPKQEAGLEQNRPNPFNPTTTLSFTLPERAEVRLTVYDAGGRVVRTLVDESRDAGVHNVTWDGRDDAGASVASGVYFSRFDAGKFTQTRKMVLLK